MHSMKRKLIPEEIEDAWLQRNYLDVEREQEELAKALEEKKKLAEIEKEEKTAKQEESQENISEKDHLEEIWKQDRFRSRNAFASSVVERTVPFSVDGFSISESSSSFTIFIKVREKV